MPKKYSANGLFAVLLSLALGALPAAAIAAPDVAPVLKGLAACQGVTSSVARLDCFDDLARRSLGGAAAQLPPTGATQPAPSAALAPAAPQSGAVAAAPAAPTSSVAEANRGLATRHDFLGVKYDEMTFVIAEVTVQKNDHLRFRMTDGTVLEQTDDTSFSKPPSAGDAVIFSRRMLGMRCKINEHDYFHCRAVTK